jgi:protein arginine N-methyltransferase 1
VTAKARLRLGDGQALEVMASPAADRPLLLFPSIGEYLAYDDQAYDGFVMASQRNAAYRQALGVASPGRVVLDIGTGRDALWAITAARAGARQVYAVEAQATVTAQAERAVRRAGLASRVQVITGRSQDVELPGQAGVCVSEIIGNIASAEGALATLADARRRLCAPGCLMVPVRAQTLAAAISLSEDGLGSGSPRFSGQGSGSPGSSGPPGGPALAQESLGYLRRIFDQAGGPFDVRLCLSGPVAGARLTSSGVVEDLDFTRDAPDASTRKARLEVRRPGLVHGFALWPRLQAWPGQPAVDALPEQERGWAPLYAPVSTEGIPVVPGDQVQVTFTRQVTDPEGHPGYLLGARIGHPDRGFTRAAWDSPWPGAAFRSSGTYRHLFATI